MRLEPVATAAAIDLQHVDKKMRQIPTSSKIQYLLNDHPRYNNCCLRLLLDCLDHVEAGVNSSAT